MNEHLYQRYKEPRPVWSGQLEHEQIAVTFCEAKQKGAPGQNHTKLLILILPLFRCSCFYTMMFCL